jgi:cytoskeleton protein RodZ
VTQQSAVSLVVSQPVANSLPRIVLGFDGESWVEVRDAAGKVVFARMNQAGVVQEVQGSGPFVLVIGNAPKVKLSWKGRPVDLAPYIKGDVARVTVQ